MSNGLFPSGVGSTNAGDWKSAWDLDPHVTYLNHGSFGPAPREVLAARQYYQQLVQTNPMDFFVRQMENTLDAARTYLGNFVGTAGKNLIFVDNATFGMNVVAESFPLQAGDEVLANDHEYGAVLRIWRRACLRAGANLIVRKLPQPLESPDQIVESLFAAVTPQTRLIVISHITSPTALIFPVQEVCKRARQQGISVCIDGPHAPAAIDIRLDQLQCDFYVASCHKWLSAPFGSGFLYVHPRKQSLLTPPVVSWGASLSGRPATWSDELLWSGTRDPSAFLSVPPAIGFLKKIGLEKFRQHARQLIDYARERIVDLTSLPPLCTSPEQWTATMIACPLPESVGETPPNHMHPLQQQLWDQFEIEIPIVNWSNRRWIRVSAHLYNDRAQIDTLVSALKTLVMDRLV